MQRYTYRLDDDSIRGYGVLTEGLVGWELGMGASGSQVIALQKNLKELAITTRLRRQARQGERRGH